MSKPSFSNIDLWLFEYAEGNLSPDQEAQLELFIIQHPELDVDRDMWEMAQVQELDVTYTDEKSLYRRKPVGSYWALGGSAAAMLLLVFGLTMYSGDNEDAINNVASNTATARSGDTASDLITSQKEVALQTEIEDLKGLVASLENELHRSRVNLKHETITLSEEVNQVPINNNPSNESSNDFSNDGSIEANAQQGISNVNSVIRAIENTGNIENTGALELQTAVSRTNQMDQIPMVKLPMLTAAEVPTKPFVLEPLTREAFENGTTVAENTSQEEDLATSANQPKTTNYNSANRHLVSNFMRKIRRMANNPIALKNGRDPYHHVPGMSVTDMNFGATGTRIAPRLQTLSRLQWEGSDNELFTNQLAFDGYAFGVRGGVGVQMTHNYYNNGGIQTGEVAITYSPKLSLNQKISFEPAVRFKMGNKILDANRMSGQSQVEMIGGNVIDYNQDLSTNVGRLLWYRDLGLGLNVNTEWFYASAQVDNIFRHQDNIYSSDLTQKRRAGTYFVATIGTDWESNDEQWETDRSNFSFSPYLVYRNFETINELWAGANFRARWFSVGASISTNMDPAASLGVISSDKRFSLMYNVDYMRSVMTSERSLSHQLTLRIVGKQSRAGRRILNQ